MSHVVPHLMFKSAAFGEHVFRRRRDAEHRSVRRPWSTLPTVSKIRSRHQVLSQPEPSINLLRARNLPSSTTRAEWECCKALLDGFPNLICMK